MHESFSLQPERQTNPEALAQEVAQGYIQLRGDTTQPPELSVVVPVYAAGETPENVLRCLTSVVHNKPNLTAEVVAVVNGSTEQLAAATQLFKHLETAGIQVVQVAFDPELKKLDKILGARQAGINAASADKVIMVDADSMVSPEWIQAYSQGLETSPFAYGPVQIQKTGDRVHDVTAGISTVAKKLKRAIGIPPMQGGNHGMNKKLLETIGVEPTAVYASVHRNEQELAHQHGALFISDAWIDTPNGYAEGGKTGLDFLKMYLRNTLQRNFKMIARKAMSGS